MRQVVALGPVRVKLACQLVKIECNAMRLVRKGGRLDHPRVLADSLDQGDFAGMLKTFQRSPDKRLRA